MNPFALQNQAVTTIGLFDSGVGGLSVFRQLTRLNNGTRLKFIYLGDTARCPYGDRDTDEILLFAKQIVDWLTAAGADSIVIACNTSASAAGAAIRVRSPVPVYDLITPAAEHLAGQAGKVAVLATNSTVRAAAFSRAIARVNRQLEVLEIACPELVPLVESGQINTAVTRNILWNYVKDFERLNVKSIILGCTHYPFLSEPLRQLLPPQIALIDPAEQLLQSLTGNRYDSDLAVPGAGYGEGRFYVTGTASAFAQTASVCLGQELPHIEHVSLEELAGQGEFEPAEAVSPVVSPAT